VAAPLAPWQGVASCTSAGCHDTNGKRGTPGSEYSTWITADPHARAYEVLREPRSADIVRTLHSKVPAHEDDRCLGCHVRPGFKWQERDHRDIHGPRFSAADGVGCEACHGASGTWLTKHYREEWQSLSPEAREKQGLRNTKALAGRANVCVGCHVGKPGLEVNHDLIAAGHPRLHFEFSVYHANLPRHWDDAKDRDPAKDDPKGPRRGRRDFEAAAWAVGQAVSARAALDLLAARARANNPWPELAEYACFACHHNLQGKSWRQSPEHYGKRPPGTMARSDWYNSAALDVALTLVPAKASPRADLAKLINLLERKIISGRKEIAGHAGAASTKLVEAAAALESTRYPPEMVRDLMERLSRQGAEGPLRSWGDAEQSYLALNALYHAWKELAPQGGPPAALRNPLEKLASRLAFPADRDSPGPEFTPQGARESCRAVYELLRRRKKAGY
jgi:hypothetical protein